MEPEPQSAIYLIKSLLEGSSYADIMLLKEMATHWLLLNNKTRKD